MTLEESVEKLDAIFAERGKDYVVNAANHPEIMRAWASSLVEELEAEIAVRENLQ